MVKSTSWIVLSTLLLVLMTVKSIESAPTDKDNVAPAPRQTTPLLDEQNHLDDTEGRGITPNSTNEDEDDFDEDDLLGRQVVIVPVGVMPLGIVRGNGYDYGYGGYRGGDHRGGDYGGHHRGHGGDGGYGHHRGGHGGGHRGGWGRK